MRIVCNKFDTKPESCRFYALPPKKERVKVHVDGKVDFSKVAASFKEKGVDVSVQELKKAHSA